MKKINNQNGFTLIELIVAVALIGILFGISISAINQAREKGMDESVASYFASIKTQSERYYSKYNRFSQSSASSVCYDKTLGFGGVDSSGLLSKVASASKSSKINLGNEIGGSWDTVTCHARSSGGVDAWVVEAPTNNSTKDSPEMYCIDSVIGVYVLKKNLLIPAQLESQLGFTCVDSQ